VGGSIRDGTDPWDVETLHDIKHLRNSDGRSLAVDGERLVLSWEPRFTLPTPERPSRTRAQLSGHAELIEELAEAHVEDLCP
jgi:hypothetical protein